MRRNQQLAADGARLRAVDMHLLRDRIPIPLRTLPGGGLVGGTSVESAGDRHSTAMQPELAIVDNAACTHASHRVPV